MPSKLETAINRNRRELVRRNARTLEEIARLYASATDPILTELTTLVNRILEATDKGETISEAWFYRAGRLETLLQQVQTQYQRMAEGSEQLTVIEQREAVYTAVQHARELAELAMGPVPRDTIVDPSFFRFNPANVEEFIGRTAAGSPVVDLFREISGNAAEAVRSIFVRQIVRGANPKETARLLQDRFEGLARNRAMTIARTETLGAYREATIRNYAENANVVQRWRWTAALNPRTCAMCLAMDGREFPVTQRFGSHPNCRCAPVPVTVSWKSVGLDIPDRKPTLPLGADWFESQDTDTQESILGPTKYARYKAGELTLSDLVGYRYDRTWGPVRWERSLTQLDSEEGQPSKRSMGSKRTERA